MADVERIAPPVPTCRRPLGATSVRVAAGGRRSSRRRGARHRPTTRNPNAIIHPNT